MWKARPHCRGKIGEKPEGKKDSTPEKPKPKRDLKDVECFNCHRKGHYSSNCPHIAYFCTERRVDHQRTFPLVRKHPNVQVGVVKKGVVEGTDVN